jgi:hypothetical protein
MRPRRGHFLLAGLLAPVWIFAQTAGTSASYALNQNGSGSGGGQLSGANIVADTSTGGSFGGAVSTVTTSGFQSKSNYIGQLTDVDEVIVSASPETINEGGTRVLSAVANMDDGTTLSNPAGTIWGFTTPLIASIDALTRTATGGTVFENTPTTVEASILGTIGNLELTVLNTNPDNFASYGGDGLDDAWQVQYFGTPPNTDAAPGENPDGDPFDNADEFLTGFSPVDGGDFLRLTIASSGSGVTNLVINKVIPDRLYTVKAGTDLSGSFNELIGGSPLSYGSETTNALVQDTAAGTRKFYVIDVQFPPPP